jgi:hypothetical protein
MFEDLFDDITNKPVPTPNEEDAGWDTGAGTTPTPAWDSGQKENLWRTGNQFWDTGNRNVAPHPVHDPDHDPDYDPDPDGFIEDEDYDEEDEDEPSAADERW